MYIDTFWIVVVGLWIAYLLWRIYHIKKVVNEITEDLDKVLQSQYFRVNRICDSICVAAQESDLFNKAPKKLVDSYTTKMAELLYDDFKCSSIERESFESGMFPNITNYLPSWKEQIGDAFGKTDYALGITESSNKNHIIKVIKSNISPM